MKKKYVLFDFDGVIADTEESNSHYLGLALKEFGVELTEKDKQRLIGTHDQELLIEFLSRAPRKVTVEQLKEIQDKYLVAGIREEGNQVVVRYLDSKSDEETTVWPTLDDVYLYHFYKE